MASIARHSRREVIRGTASSSAYGTAFKVQVRGLQRRVGRGCASAIGHLGCGDMTDGGKWTAAATEWLLSEGQRLLDLSRKTGRFENADVGRAWLAEVDEFIEKGGLPPNLRAPLASTSQGLRDFYVKNQIGRSMDGASHLKATQATVAALSEVVHALNTTHETVSSAPLAPKTGASQIERLRPVPEHLKNVVRLALVRMEELLASGSDDQALRDAYLHYLPARLDAQGFFISGSAEVDGWLVEAAFAVETDPSRRQELIALLRACGAKSPGRTVGEKFYLERKLGEGHFGEVWAARLPTHSETVAVKLAKPNSKAVLALRREAMCLIRLSDECFPKLYSAGFQINREFIAMEFADGKRMDSWLESSPSSEERIHVLAQMALALAGAHSKQEIYHRDLKLENIVISTWGVPKILDFGVAKTTLKELHTTQAQQVANVRNSAPEYVEYMLEADDSDVFDYGAKQDAWSFACICYQTFSGRHPFEDDDLLRTIFNIRTRELVFGFQDLPVEVTAALKGVFDREATRRTDLVPLAQALARVDPRATRNQKGHRIVSQAQVTADSIEELTSGAVAALLRSDFVKGIDAQMGISRTDADTDDLLQSERIAAQLKYVGMITIGDVVKGLISRGKLLVRQFEAQEKEMYRGSVATRGIALYQLFLVVLAEQGDEAAMNRALDVFRIGEKDDRSEFAKKYIQLFRGVVGDALSKSR